jgi:exodeoxyribonuclease VII large subunit
LTNSLFDLPFEEPPESDERGPQGSASEETAAQEITPEPRRVYSVSQLTDRIRTLLEERFFEVWVEGEISNCFVAKTGHMYFTLKDTQAQIKAGDVPLCDSISPLQAAGRPARGGARTPHRCMTRKASIKSSASTSNPKGSVRGNSPSTSSRSGWRAEGLVRSAAQTSAACAPRKIGVVTSLDGAAVRDIIKVLRRRYANAHIVIRPTRVQGEGAALEIARAMAANWQGQGRGRRHRRTRRRIDRGPLGVQ